MIYDVVSYNGHALNSGNYLAFFAEEMAIQADSAVIYVKRAGYYPVNSGKDLSGRTLPLVVRVVAGTYGDASDELGGWFDTGDTAEHALIIQDSSDSNKQWYLMCTATKMVWADMSVMVSLAAADPIWRSVTVNSTSGSVVSSGSGMSITPGGNRAAQPVLRFVPYQNKPSGSVYSYWKPFYNRTDAALKNYPVDITLGGMNTSTLVSGSAMQADGDDIRIYVDGAQVNRWLGNVNTSATTIWINLDFDAKIELPISAAIASSGAITTISIKPTTANKKALKRIGAAGLVQIGTEFFSFTGWNVKTMKLTGVTRAQRNSSMAAHAVGDTLIWIQHEITMTHGDLTAATPTIDDTTKPMFAVEQSTNIKWVFEYFAESTGKRSGSWKPAVVNAKRALGAGTYTGTLNTDEDPASVMGMSNSAILLGNKWRGNDAVCRWTLSNPVILTAGSFVGIKSRNSTTYPKKAHLEYRKLTASGDKFTEAWNEGGIAGWSTGSAAFTRYATFGAGANAIDVELNGSVGSVADNVCLFEITSGSVAIDSTKTPTYTASGSSITTQASYLLDWTIENAATGDSITLDAPVPLNSVIEVNCDHKTVMMNGDTNLLGALTLNGVRQEWLPLTSGSANALTLTDTSGSVGGVYWTTSWEDRNG